jgi:hypothetical protein
MAQIRRDLHADVQGVVQGAEAATDWRRYIRDYPWASLGAALVVGYMIVPHKRQPATIQLAQAEPSRTAVAEAPRPAEEKKGKGLLGMVFGLVAPVALRAAQGYALQFAEQWLAGKVAEQMQQHPDLAAAFGGQAAGPSSGPQPWPPGPQARPPGTPRF